MNFKEYLNETNKIELSKVNDIPSFLKSYNAEIINRSLSHVFAKINDFNKTLFLKLYYGNKDGGSIHGQKNTNMSQIDTSKYYFGHAYFAKSKAAEKRGDFTDIKSKSDFDKYFK